MVHGGHELRVVHCARADAPASTAAAKTAADLTAPP
jgi:hypothetical protein